MKLLILLPIDPWTNCTTSGYCQSALDDSGCPNLCYDQSKDCDWSMEKECNVYDDNGCIGRSNYQCKISSLDGDCCKVNRFFF